MQYLDKHGWPVEIIKGRPVRSFIRRLIHTRKLKLGTWKQTPFHSDDSCACVYSSRSPNESCEVCDGQDHRERLLKYRPEN